jgi:hypothetical protein
MPQRDIFHDAAKNALIKDGWEITADPLVLQFGGRNIYVDLEAELPMAAQKEGRKIAVEVKSFNTPSEVNDLEKALGQYVMYRELIARKEPERALYLAISIETYEGIFSEPLGELMVATQSLKLLIFDEIQEVILQWID